MVFNINLHVDIKKKKCIMYPVKCFVNLMSITWIKTYSYFGKWQTPTLRLGVLHLCYSLNISIRCLSWEKEEGELGKKKKVFFFNQTKIWFPSHWAAFLWFKVGFESDHRSMKCVFNHRVYVKIAATNLYY